MFLESIHGFIPFIEQISKGLHLHGVMDGFRKKPEIGMALLCLERSTFMNWTYDDLQQGLIANYSDAGSNHRVFEVNVFKAFIDAIEAIFHDGMKFYFKNNHNSCQL